MASFIALAVGAIALEAFVFGEVGVGAIVVCDVAVWSWPCWKISHVGAVVCVVETVIRVGTVVRVGAVVGVAVSVVRVAIIVG